MGGAAPDFRDPSNRSVDPVYSDPTTGDLRLSAASPLIDVGELLGIDVNGSAPGLFNGTAPDLGAWESP